MGSTLKGKDFAPPGANSFPLRADPHFERTILSRETDSKSQKLFPFVKLAVKYEGVAMY